MSTKLEQFMVSAAKGAGRILMNFYERTYRVETKKGAGIVTEADKQAESYLIKKIFRKYPDSSIITEETGEYRGTSSYCWIIDPLDGTSNFAHGFPWFCVSMGLYLDGKPKAGVIYQPKTREIFFAEVGKGTRLNGKRVRVSKERSIENCLLGTGFYYSKGKTLWRQMKPFFRLNEQALGVRRPGSAALDLAYVACGRYDGFWEKGLNSWDVAAGFIMISESGGKISGYDGKSVSINDAEVIASNGLIHKKLVKLVSA